MKFYSSVQMLVKTVASVAIYFDEIKLLILHRVGDVW